MDTCKDFYHSHNKEVLHTLKNNPNPSSLWQRMFSSYDTEYVIHTIFEKTKKLFRRRELDWGNTHFLLGNPESERYTQQQTLDRRGGWDNDIHLVGMKKPAYFSFRKPFGIGFVIDEFGEEELRKSFAPPEEGLRFVRTAEQDELNFLLKYGFRIALTEEKVSAMVDIDGTPLGLRNYKLYSLSK